MKKNIIGLLVAFALILTIAVPGALVVHADETEAVAETVKALTDADCTCDGERDAEGKLPEGFVHNEGCPLSEPVAQSEGESNGEPTVTSGEDEGGTLTDPEGSSVQETADPAEAPTEAPSEPEEPTHIEDCSDECDGVDCECECHKIGLFDRLMECNTLEELLYEVSLLTEEEFSTLTEDQMMQLEYRVVEFVPELLEDAPANEQNEMPSDALVPSEIVHVTKNVTNVAPFSSNTVG